MTYVCNGGYTLAGAAVATCQADGTFTGAAPTCAPVACGAPPAVSNAGSPLVSGGAGGGNSDTFGATAAYACNAGFAKSGADPTCGSAGTWSTAPTCAANPDAGGVDSGTGADAGCSVTYPTDWANWPVSDSPNKFTDNGDGTIYDANTGLTWMKTALSGGSWGSLGLCKCPWRGPERIELLSIVDYTRSKPAVNATYFNIGSVKIWTATMYALYAGRAWNVDFTDGSLGGDSTTYGSANVLCVKGSTTAPASRYTVLTSDAGVAEVLDNGTGLHWEQAAASGTYNNAAAASQCASPYRLPAISELMTMTDSYVTTPPAFDLTVFPGIGGTDTYWASTAGLQDPGYAYGWALGAYGASAGEPVAAAYRARCVR